MKSFRRGFTLIELLVVIAIIGLLASIILASLNTAQQKGRDARRVSDLAEIGQAMVAGDNGTGGTTITGCTTAPCNVSALAITGGQSLSGYADPSSTTKCSAKPPTGVCDYTEEISAPTTQNYEVCAYLEAGSGTLPKGAISVSNSSSGSVVSGCN